MKDEERELFMTPGYFDDPEDDEETSTLKEGEEEVTETGDKDLDHEDKEAGIANHGIRWFNFTRDPDYQGQDVDDSATLAILEALQNHKETSEQIKSLRKLLPDLSAKKGFSKQMDGITFEELKEMIDSDGLINDILITVDPKTNHHVITIVEGKVGATKDMPKKTTSIGIDSSSTSTTGSIKIHPRHANSS